MTDPNPDPFQQFEEWYAVARKELPTGDPTAVALSTLDDEGCPDTRWVLLKAFDARGFVFYTNFNSPKAKALKARPQAALAFLWDFGNGQQWQVRVQGSVEVVSDAEADAYWASRPRLSQLGSLTSKQSEPLSSRMQFMKELAVNTARFGTGPVPRPPHWSGFRVKPRRFEFWQGRPNRLHDRFLYTLDEKGTWSIQRLYP